MNAGTAGGLQPLGLHILDLQGLRDSRDTHLPIKAGEQRAGVPLGFNHWRLRHNIRTHGNTGNADAGIGGCHPVNFGGSG